MANGNGAKNNTTVSGEIKDDGSSTPTGPRTGGPRVVVNEPTAAPAAPQAPRTSVPAPFAPNTGMTPVVATGGLLALGGAAIYGYHWWRQRQALAAGEGSTPLPNGSGQGQGAPPPNGSGQTQATPPQSGGGTPTQGAPPATDPNYWGTTSRGAEFRSLLTEIEKVSRMPLRLFLSVVANREAGWNRKARNLTAVETAASKRAIEAGPDRGNPTPKFATSLAGAGSGGLFGALAPYVAWTGLDEDFMPYLDADYTIVEDPIVAAICAAKYYQRIVTFYPTVFASGTPAPEDNYRVRLGWASPNELKKDPAGKLFQAVKGRMDEDLAELGLKITDLPPPDASRWPGLKAVVEGMKSLTPTWK
ncbi:hypothetical protein SAMN02745121_08976 [Nannocystis exedens]|uniref:Uncharacterized protein n=1 Tax=Nannocystis exedens TaxID=54 RepID=A0A1I2IVQ4_9BACT|nr:hypothetical protein [Nannocystis exedens]PCC69321.1 hypothetical protein NAEX_02343 [Nannocystis exedens]SFF45748.1 hypothetical protein SAMN02745121_08976 [Nannocystis exedens]